jgi:prolipoprotein diacylglyceryltransferase
VRLDPFRIQFWTVSLDSQIVLAVVGLVVAGLLVRKAARQEALDLDVGDWWDLVLYAVVGGRLLWVLGHAAYYVRQPLQVFVILDGGLSAVGLALGAAFWIGRHWRAHAPVAGAQPWRRVVDLVAIGVLTALLFERTGCALTTCGSGPASDLPWAMLRGDGWQMPLALEQVGVLAVALAVSTEMLARRGVAFTTALVALALVTLIELMAGRPVVEPVLVLGALAAIYWAAGARAASTRERPAVRHLEES